MTPSIHSSSGKAFTLTEVLVAVILMSVALIPVLKASVGAQVLGTRTERATQALTYGVYKIEEIRGRAAASFATDFNATAQVLAGLYVYTVADDLGASLKTVRVAVWHDTNGNRARDNDEMEAVLDTKIARKR